MIRNAQTPSAVVLIRPHYFLTNPLTAADNAFQSSDNDSDADLSKSAYDEVTKAAEQLQAQGICTHVFEDKSTETPDSVFPNNWFSTHSGGHVAVYPMFPLNRRKERRWDVIEMLKTNYRVQDVVDYSGLEADGIFLEGTGAMVLDHIDRVAYAVQSNRTNPLALERFCSHFNYEPMLFEAVDANHIPVYHTNVIMCIATEYVLICLDMIVDQNRRDEIVKRFEESGREIIALSHEQIANFAGNAIELQGGDGRVLALSLRAMQSLKPEQVAIIEKSASLLPLDVPTIEKSGGSVRCMLAGIHLSPR